MSQNISHPQTSQERPRQLTDREVMKIVKHLYHEMETQEKQNLLDHQNLAQFKINNIRPMYPHKIVVNENDETKQKTTKIQKFNCCYDISWYLTPGSTCCGCFCDIKPPDKNYQKFGLGANIYFNFMNHFTFCFLFLSIFSIFALSVAYLIGLQNDVNPIENYQNFFFATTIGTFTANDLKCKYAAKNERKFEFNLTCSVGTILRYLPVFTENTEESISNCRVETQKFLKSDTSNIIPGSLYKIDKENCTQSPCKVIVQYNNDATNIPSIISFPYQCKDSGYKFFGSNDFKIVNLTYIFVAMDWIIIIGFLFFLCSEKKGQDKLVDHFKQSQLTLKDFSVKISGFSSRNFDKQFHSFVETILAKDEKFKDHIVQVKTSYDEQIISLSYVRRQKYQKLYKLMTEYFFQKNINPSQQWDVDVFIKSSFQSAEDYVTFQQKLVKQLKQFRESFLMLQGILKRRNRQMSIYMVFSQIEDVKKLLELRQKQCCNQYLKTTDGNYYTIKQAPIPDMLQWENRTKQRLLRITISWLITIAIVGGSYVFFGLVQSEQKKLLSDYKFDTNCKFYFNDTDFTNFNSSINPKVPLSNSSLLSNLYTNCFCQKNYFSSQPPSGTSENCSQWRRNYLLFLGIPILISFGIVIYNIIVSLFFKLLTRCEGHFKITNQMFSYILKRSFLLIMNMGLIILVLNFKFSTDNSNVSNQVNFLFQGRFDDLTSDWYIGVAPIIIVTMVFNIIFPIMELLITTGQKLFRKCRDTRCWKIKTSQKYKQGYISLYEGDVYPIEQRYALVIAIFCITMIFNCVIPLLNVVAVISLLLLKPIDKFLVFKYFKIPLSFDQELHGKFMKILYIILILHCVTTAFFLSQPTLVPSDANIDSLRQTQTYNRLRLVFTTSYIIPYIVLLFLLSLYAIFKETLFTLIQSCRYQMTASSKEQTKNYFESLSVKKLKKMQKSVEKERDALEKKNIVIEKQLKKEKEKDKNTLSNSHEHLASYETLEENSPQILGLNPSTQGNLAEKQEFQNLQSAKNLNQPPNNKEYHTLYQICENTCDKLAKHLLKKEILSKQEQEIEVMIGMPGYNMSDNEFEAEKDRQIARLDALIKHLNLRESE